MRFSIIIPAYNVEGLIEDCLNSIVFQDFPKEEYEIIIVEDCSTDNTYARIQDLVKDYHKNPDLSNLNITVIKHDVNKRQGGGRNTGLKVAKGEYIMFVDSDDCWLYGNVLSTFSRIIDEFDVDVVESSNTGQFATPHLPLATYRRSICKYRITPVERFTGCKMEFPVWNKAYKHSYIKSINLEFAEGVYFEDSDWGIMSLALAKDIDVIDFPFYGYRMNPTSTLNLKNRKLFIDDIKGIERTMALIKERYIPDEVGTNIKLLIKRIICNYLRYSRNFALKDSIAAIHYLQDTGLLSMDYPGSTIGERIKLLLLRRAAVPVLTLRKLLTFVINDA